MVFLYIAIFLLTVFTVLYFQNKGTESASVFGFLSCISLAAIAFIFLLIPMERKQSSERKTLDSSLVFEKGGFYYVCPEFSEMNPNHLILKSKEKPTGILVTYEVSLAGNKVGTRYAVLTD